MALWAKTQQLPPEVFQQVNNLYTPELFPIEVRHYLAPWIEEQNWSEIDPDNLAFLPAAQEFVQQLIGKLSEVANRNDLEFLQKLQIQKYIEGFKRYLASPLELVKVIRHCLNNELRLIQQVDSGGFDGSIGVDPSSGNLWIVQKLDELRRATQQTSAELRQLEQEQEAFWLQYNEYNRLNAAISANLAQAAEPQKPELEKKFSRQKEQHENNLKGKASRLVSGRLALAEKYKETVSVLQQVQSRVLDVDLTQWKREQQLAGNGAPFNNNLEIIQGWCESLADLIWTNRQQIKELERLLARAQAGTDGADIVAQLRGQITQLLSSLVTSTFVIEKQPPQVMKTNTRFTATVRLLVGGKLNVHMTPPQVRVNILSDTQANSLMRSEQAARTESSGDILNNSGTMEYIAATRQLVVNFRNMQLRKIKRAEKKGTESVMDEKFSLLFMSQFTIGAGELDFQVWTLSLPVVVIVHGNQEPHAWATVSWDNAFAESPRPCFVVPERVPWPQVADMLNTKFQSACGRSLTEDNLKFLAGKAFRNHNMTDYSQAMLNWNLFAKEPLQDRNFTFWEWFFGILKLTKDHLRNLWNDGLIMGFVGKMQGTDMLMKQSVGTFLLRFSDSELGGISIAVFKAEAQGQAGPGVEHLQPWTSKDFGIRSLADRLGDLSNLQFLYPDIPKDQAFQKYYAPQSEVQPCVSTGYVKPVLVTHVPGWSGGNTDSSYPNTPAYYPQSPQDPRSNPGSVLSPGSEAPAHLMQGFGDVDWSLLDDELVSDFPQDFPMDQFSQLNLAPFLNSNMDLNQQ